MNFEDYTRKNDTEYLLSNINPKNAGDIYRVLSKCTKETVKLSISLMNGFEQQGLLFAILEYIKSTPKEWDYDGLRVEFNEVLEIIKQEK